MYFWNYGLRKAWLDNCLKSPVSEDPSTINMGNGSKHCWKLDGSTFPIFIVHFWRQVNWKKSLLVIWKILSLFVNTLTSDSENSPLNRNKLNQPRHIQLYQKQKIFFPILFAFLKSLLNFQHFKQRWPWQLMFFRNYRLR